MLQHAGATSAWRDWYRASHGERFAQTQGTAFEAYVTSALSVAHGEGFVNPAPKGQLGDGGCDGITGIGDIAYACFGYLPHRNVESKLAEKLADDFARAEEKWPSFVKWRFVSNLSCGPLAAGEIVRINQEHSAGSERPLTASYFTTDNFWNELLLPLTTADLDKLFPGVPHASNISLADLFPLLDRLSQTTLGEHEDVPAGEVSAKKMDYNSLSPRVRLEFQDARIHMPAINEWFAGHSDPTLRDSQGNKFREIYINAAKASTTSNEIVERLYVSLGGEDFRYDEGRANAVYAVTTFFFDECDIFKLPPPGWDGYK